MSRKTLEAIVKENGVSSNNLKTGIEKLVNEKQMAEEVKEWSHEVRLVGNNGAHFESLEQVSQEDAKALLSFIEYLFQSLYGLRSELQKRRAAKVT